MSHWKKNQSDPGKPVVVAPPAPDPSAPSASSRNAMKHGCCAVDTLILPDENIEDYKALDQIWCRAYNPQTEPERHLVAELVQADWFLQRATRKYNEVESELYKSNPNPAEWTEAQDRKLGRFLRYKTAHTNTVIKCRKAIEDYRKAKLAETAAAEKSALSAERLKAAQKKASPVVDWRQHLKNMRAQAEALGYVPPGTPNPFDK
jgi:hypothetical protein